jgi:hypothetical protein
VCLVAPFSARGDVAPPYLVTALVNQKAKKCLGVAGTDAPSRGRVILEECDGKPDQRWIFRPVSGGDGWHEVVNERSNLCLDVQGYDADEKDPIILYACDKKKDQYWYRSSQGSTFQLRSAMGPLVIYETGSYVPLLPPRCLNIEGDTGLAGSTAAIWRCTENIDQVFAAAATGVVPKIEPSPSGTVPRICVNGTGTCLTAPWTQTGSTITANGDIAVTGLPGLPAPSNTLQLKSGAVTVQTGGDFALVGTATLGVDIPIGTTKVGLKLPSGKVAFGYGNGLTSALRARGEDGAFTIGGVPYKLESTGLYAHTLVDSAGSVNLGGLSTGIGSGGTTEVMIGYESRGPAVFYSGGCTVVLPGIGSASNCTVGWFGSQGLNYTLNSDILNPDAALPDGGDSLSKVRPSVQAGLLVGGDFTFTAVPAVTVNGMMALDPDTAAASSVSFTDLNRARAGLEGDAHVNVGPFSMKLADAALLYDQSRKQLDVSTTMKVDSALDPFGNQLDSFFSGDAFLAGRFGATRNDLVFDFSGAKIFGFDLKQFQGSVNFNTQIISVAGKLQLGDAEWIGISGEIGANGHLALTSAVNLAVGGVAAKVSVGTKGLSYEGSYKFLGETYTIRRTFTAPATIKSEVIGDTVTVLGQSVSFHKWAQYNISGDNAGSWSMKAKATASVFGLDVNETYNINSSGQINFAGTTVQL